MSNAGLRPAPGSIAEPRKVPRSKKVTQGHDYIYYARVAAKIAMFIKAFRFIEVLIAPLEKKLDGEKGPLKTVCSPSTWTIPTELCQNAGSKAARQIDHRRERCLFDAVSPCRSEGHNEGLTLL